MNNNYIKKYILAGYAVFSLISPLKTKYTYKIIKEKENYYQCYLVPDNNIPILLGIYHYTNDYFVFLNNNELYIEPAFLKYLKLLLKREGKLMKNFTFIKSNICPRCGKTLHTEKSLASGYGLKCYKRYIKKVGYGK